MIRCEAGLSGWHASLFYLVAPVKSEPPQKAIITYLRKIKNKAVYLLCIAIKYQNSVIYHFDYKIA